jgi:hypothetical protein
VSRAWTVICQAMKFATALLGHTSPAQTARYLRDRQEVVAEGPSFGDLISIEAEKAKS